MVSERPTRRGIAPPPDDPSYTPIDASDVTIVEDERHVLPPEETLVTPPEAADVADDAPNSRRDEFDTVPGGGANRLSGGRAAARAYVGPRTPSPLRTGPHDTVSVDLDSSVGHEARAFPTSPSLQRRRVSESEIGSLPPVAYERPEWIRALLLVLVTAALGFAVTIFLRRGPVLDPAPGRFDAASTPTVREIEAPPVPSLVEPEPIRPSTTSANLSAAELPSSAPPSTAPPTAPSPPTPAPPAVPSATVQGAAPAVAPKKSTTPSKSKDGTSSRPSSTTTPASPPSGTDPWLD